MAAFVFDPKSGRPKTATNDVGNRAPFSIDERGRLVGIPPSGVIQAEIERAEEIEKDSEEEWIEGEKK